MSASGASASPLRAVLRRLALGEALPSGELTGAFAVVMNGDASPAHIAALLMGLRVRGETPTEVAAVARALRNVMIVLPARDPSSLVDTCGTGGGSLATFNISTAAALLAAGAGLRIAKHGNRSFTTQCGSADVLEALGVSINRPVEVMAHALERAGIVFMFAPLMHPAMRHVGPVRSELGVPTVMNIVGPLANPARAGRQVVGVADEGRIRLIAGALQELGTVHSLVVHGLPGLDEVSPLGPTRVIELQGQDVREWVVEPTRYGLSASPAELAGGSPTENARIVAEVLEGKGTPGATAAVVLNAAAALLVGGLARDYDEAVQAAIEAVDRRSGVAALHRLRQAYLDCGGSARDQ